MQLAIDDEWNDPISQIYWTEGVNERDSLTAADFQCIIDVIEIILGEYGLEEGWEKVKLEIEPNMEKLKKCKDEV